MLTAWCRMRIARVVVQLVAGNNADALGLPPVRGRGWHFVVRVLVVCMAFRHSGCWLCAAALCTVYV